MAVAAISFPSPLLHRPTALNVLLPDASPIRGVLYLLHGYSDGHASFLCNSALARYCAGLPLAVIMPEAQCSFYLDTAYGQPYWRHISEEVPRLLRQWLRLDVPRACTFVGGISMGGYGAAKLALQKPEQFAQAYLLSPLTDLDAVSRHGFDRERDADAPPLEDLHFDALLGGRPVAGTGDDLYFLLAHADGAALPQFSMYTGTEDFMYHDILHFADTLTAKGAHCALHTAPGRHVWTTWEPFLADMAARIGAQLS